jgi:hypothetical protein
MKLGYFIIPFLFFIGCGSGGSSSTQSVSGECVEVDTLGAVRDAVVTDGSNQQAVYDAKSGKYCFSSEIVYPVSVRTIDSTYIDVDYDGNKTANDLLPKFTELKSYFNYVDLVTDMHARAVENNLSYYEHLDLNDSNTTVNVPNLVEVVNAYKNKIEDKYAVNLDTPGTGEKVLNFVAYDENLSGEVNIDTDMFSKFNDLLLFFNQDLNVSGIDDRVKYYSFYHSLELLDKKLVERVDTVHKPIITYLHPNNLPLSKNFLAIKTDIISKDIKMNNNEVYVASGLDGVFKLNDNLGVIGNVKVNNTFSNSYNLDVLNTSDNSYLLTADGGEGISLFNITGGSFINLNKIFWKYYDNKQAKDVPVTIDDSKGLKQVDELISVKTYVSPFENTMWLAFGSANKGLYLVDLKKIISKFDDNSSYPIIVSDTDNDANNNLLIAGDGGSVYSETFSSDGENLYATKTNIIERYDLSSILSVTSPSGTYTIQGNNAYNLQMITKNGVDELFVSTDEGVEMYDVLNNGDLSFVNKYTTEGAQTGYMPKMSFISDKNILLVTDGYKGLKAIKYDSAFNPMLCGADYF